ncbi:MAG TPA: hypothetical protein PKA58_21890, partial [Polyangium sp.]|nr:hypothetical protein [Polyangium sp.]
KYVDSASLDAAIEVLGPRAEKHIDALDAEGKAGLISFLVRNLRELSVEEATDLERKMLREMGAVPRPTKTLTVKDEISVITLRNYVRYLCVYLGMEWNRGMLLQSAVSDLARFALARGAGTFEISAAREKVSFRVHIDGQVALGGAWLSSSNEPLLAGVRNLARGLRSSSGTQGSQLEFDVEWGVAA